MPCKSRVLALAAAPKLLITVKALAMPSKPSVVLKFGPADKLTAALTL